jgi:hypothetical protein
MPKITCELWRTRRLVQSAKVTLDVPQGIIDQCDGDLALAFDEYLSQHDDDPADWRTEETETMDSGTRGKPQLES